MNFGRGQKHSPVNVGAVGAPSMCFKEVGGAVCRQRRVRGPAEDGERPVRASPHLGSRRQPRTL